MKFINIFNCFVLCIVSITFFSCEYLDLGNSDSLGLSDETIIEGLKEVLNTGIDIQADNAAVLDSGYYKHEVIKILLPEGAENAVYCIENTSDFLDSVKNSNPIAFIAIEALSAVFFANFSEFRELSDKLLRSLNNAAETAAPASKQIFFDAIKAMTITDAMSILNGSDTAATVYLKAKTFEPLKDVFLPIVENALNTVNATKYWEDFFISYNEVINSFKTIVAMEKQLGLDFGLENIVLYDLDTVDTDLPDYTTTKALIGLFYLVGQEEIKIRDDPFQYGKKILEQVFG